MSRWTRLSFTLKAPKLPGIYSVSVHGFTIYVGSSANLDRRMRQHGIIYGPALTYTPWGVFYAEACEVKYRVVTRGGDWLRREWRLLQRIRPHFCKIRGRVSA